MSDAAGTQRAPVTPASVLHRFSVDFGLPVCSFTCVHATASRVALGTSQGVVHIVSRSIAEQGVHRGERLASIAPAASRDGHRGPRKADWSVAVVRLSEGAGQQDAVACATASGALSVYHVGAGGLHELAYRWKDKSAAKGRAFTQMVWGGQEGFLFTGDTAGVVVCHDCKRGRAREVARLGSAVVQMDVGVVEGRVTLLVSAADRCVSITSPQVDGEAQVKQVGTKLRTQPLGACFYRPATELLRSGEASGSASAPPPATTPATVCCCRPGRRLWLADAHTGVVRSTLRFSAPFEAVPFATGGNDKLFTSPTKPAFGRVLPAALRVPHGGKGAANRGTPDSAAGVAMPLLLSWDQDTLHVLDPATILETGGVVEWHVDLGRIISLAVCPAFPCSASASGPNAKTQFSVVYVLHRRAQDAVPIVSVLSPLDAIATQGVALQMADAVAAVGAPPLPAPSPIPPTASVAPRFRRSPVAVGAAASAGAGAGAGAGAAMDEAAELAGAIDAATAGVRVPARRPGASPLAVPRKPPRSPAFSPVTSGATGGAGMPRMSLGPPVRASTDTSGGHRPRWGSAESADAGAGRVRRRSASFVEIGDSASTVGTTVKGPSTGLSAAAVQAKQKQRRARAVAAQTFARNQVQRSNTLLTGLGGRSLRGQVRRSSSVWSVSSSPAILRSTADPLENYNAMVGHVHEFPLRDAHGETLYEIHLMVYLGPNAGVCACTNHTLEDFRALHRTLRRTRNTNFKFDLPKSRWFGNQKPATIRYRAMRLDKYIKHALQIPAVVKHPAFIEFIGMKRALGVDDDDDRSTRSGSATPPLVPRSPRNRSRSAVVPPARG